MPAKSARARRTETRRADEQRKAAAKDARSQGFSPNKNDGIPAVSRSVAQSTGR